MLRKKSNTNMNAFRIAGSYNIALPPFFSRTAPVRSGTEDSSHGFCPLSSPFRLKSGPRLFRQNRNAALCALDADVKVRNSHTHETFGRLRLWNGQLFLEIEDICRGLARETDGQQRRTKRLIRKMLRSLLAAEPRPASARSLALCLGVPTETVKDVLEPTLVRLGYVTIGAGGRRLTDKGRDHVEREVRQFA